GPKQTIRASGAAFRSPPTSDPNLARSTSTTSAPAHAAASRANSTPSIAPLTRDRSIKSLTSAQTRTAQAGAGLGGSGGTRPGSAIANSGQRFRDFLDS